MEQTSTKWKETLPLGSGFVQLRHCDGTLIYYFLQLEYLFARPPGFRCDVTRILRGRGGNPDPSTAVYVAKR